MTLEVNSKAFLVLLLTGLLFIGAACSTIPKRISRDTLSYIAETLGSVQREEAAAKELLRAARTAWQAGDEFACTAYAQPALASLARARAEGYRALWLAGLPYPDAARWPEEPGHVPSTRVEQPDPGPPGPTPPTGYVCTPAWPPDPYPAAWPILEAS